MDTFLSIRWSIFIIEFILNSGSINLHIILKSCILILPTKDFVHLTLILYFLGFRKTFILFLFSII